MNLRVKGISIGDFADKMEIKRESLSRTINGNPMLDPPTKIVHALDISV